METCLVDGFSVLLSSLVSHVGKLNSKKFLCVLSSNLHVIGTVLQTCQRCQISWGSVHCFMWSKRKFRWQVTHVHTPGFQELCVVSVTGKGVFICSHSPSWWGSHASRCTRQVVTLCLNSESRERWMTVLLAFIFNVFQGSSPLTFWVGSPHCHSPDVDYCSYSCPESCLLAILNPVNVAILIIVQGFSVISPLPEIYFSPALTFTKLPKLMYPGFKSSRRCF